jgi:DNA-binding transcriptional ArsR family regulator
MGRPDVTAALRHPTETELDHAASVLQLLSDRSRLGIIAILLDGDESSVGDIARRLDRPVPAISQHLAKLKSGRLVLARREGTSILYRIGGEHVSALVENLLQHTEHELFAEPPHHTAARP